MEKNSRDSLNELKFGEKIYFEDMSDGGSSSKPVASPVLPAAPLPGKRGKGAAQASGQPPVPPPRCQVEGCNLDLTGAKSYYCRHKVCGMHSKSPKVIVAGLDQRFCQQCSRFHLLTEFDQGKRSCRRRLAGHNERRRKPSLEPLPPCYSRMPSFHDLVLSEDSSGYRSFLMDFTHPRPPDAARDIWPTIRSSDRAATNQWQGRNFHTSGGVISNTRAECIADISDSTCALSLLSTQPWGAAGASAAPTNQQTELGTALPNIASSYMDSSWAFKDHAAWSSSNEMGLRQIKDAGDGQFLGELELALEENRHCPEGVGTSEVYDHHLDMHWSL